MENIKPSAVQKIGDTLAIAWSDGREDYLSLNLFRKACPCASCQGEPDVLGKPGPATVEPASASTDLRSWQIIGGYGLQPRWADGHSTGIYSFGYLRQLGADPRR